MEPASEQASLLGFSIVFFTNTKQNPAAKSQLGELHPQLSASSVYPLTAGQTLAGTGITTLDFSF